MIKVRSVVINEGEAVTLPEGIRLMGSAFFGSRPSAMTISTDRERIEIPNFSSRLYNPSAAVFASICEVVIWNGVALIVGLPSVVVAARGGLARCDFFRKADEDSGFYRTQWVDGGQVLFCIYESGVIAWNDVGEVLWHVPKFWDDIFVEFDAGGLVFMAHGGEKFIIDQVGSIVR